MYIAIFGKEMTATHCKRAGVIIRLLSERGAELSYFRGFLDQMTECEKLPEGTLFTSSDDLPPDIDIFLSFGGDGTLLKSLMFIKDREIPVAGINFGRLGFLTTVKTDDDENVWIDNLINRRYEIEHRTMIEIETPGMPEDFYPKAVNEITIQRKDSQMLGVEVTIDNYPMPTYWSDGLLISTPTGSTAYSLSIGGPIVTPEAKILIIAPIAPHNLNVRPLVVPDNSEIEIKITSRSDKVLITLDNRGFESDTINSIKIRKSGNHLNYFSLGSKGFIAALNEKLLWGEDKRNEG